jgi:hypothetical protein
MAIKGPLTAAQRRGRNNRKRGNSIELWACKELGISRTGMFGGKADGGRHDEWLVIQVKSGPSNFSEKVWGLLESLNPNASQLKAVVFASADGPGVKRRAYVVTTLDDFKEWFGGRYGSDTEDTE